MGPLPALTATATAASTASSATAAEGSGLLQGMRLLAGGTVVATVLLTSGDSAKDDNRRPYLYVTYTRVDPETGQVYSGRTGGYGTPEQLVLKRAAGQAVLNAEGFAPPTVDRWTTDYHAILGREQQLIDFYGGARSVGGTARNLINGVADFNPNRPFYMNATRREFGDLPDNSPQRLRLDWR